MTAPLAQGFPDWQRNAPAANVLYENAVHVTTGNQTYGPFFVGYTPAFGLFADPSAGNFDMLIAWFADQNEFQFLDQQVISVDANGYFAGAIKNLGPWVTVTVLPGGATATYDLKLWATNLPGMWARQSDSTILISQSNINLAAGGTATYTAAATWIGPVRIEAAQNSAAFTVDVQALNAAGVAELMGHHASTWSPKYEGTLFLPPRIIQVVIHNSDAAAHGHYVYLIAHDRADW